METEVDLFREEDLLLKQLDQVGRLDTERELDRLLNVLNDILVEQSPFDPTEIEPLYVALKKRLTREYYRTEVLGVDATEMTVWHLSMFSSLEYLQKLLIYKGFEDPSEVRDEFETILDGHFIEQLQRFSETYDIDDLTERLPEPEVFRQDDLEVHYWYDIGPERYAFTERTGETTWQTASTAASDEIQVQRI